MSLHKMNPKLANFINDWNKITFDAKIRNQKRTFYNPDSFARSKNQVIIRMPKKK